MTGRLIRTAVALYLAAALAVGYPGFAQAQAQQTAPAQAQTTTQAQSPAAQQTPAALPYPNLRSGPNYSKGRQWFPNIFAPYFSINVPPPDLTNTPAIYSLIHDGKLELSLQDAISLALQNNLDIRVQRYLPWFGETDVLRAEGGGTPTGSFVLGSGG